MEKSWLTGQLLSLISLAGVGKNTAGKKRRMKTAAKRKMRGILSGNATEEHHDGIGLQHNGGDEVLRHASVDREEGDGVDIGSMGCSEDDMDVNQRVSASNVP